MPRVESVKLVCFTKLHELRKSSTYFAKNSTSIVDLLAFSRMHFHSIFMRRGKRGDKIRSSRRIFCTRGASSDTDYLMPRARIGAARWISFEKSIRHSAKSSLVQFLGRDVEKWIFEAVTPGRSDEKPLGAFRSADRLD